MELDRDSINVEYFRMIKEKSRVDLPMMINMSGWETDVQKLFMAIIAAGEIQIHDGKYTFIYPEDEECVDAFIRESSSVKISIIDDKNIFYTVYMDIFYQESKKRLQMLLQNTQ